MSKQAHYHVGIDLGTTHTVVAYCPFAAKDGEAKLFEIAQLTAPGQVASQPLLPSARYHPAVGELSDADTAFLAADDQAVIGEAARVLGAKSQGRLVSSAKSWLSHPSVDHSAAILPWGAPDEVAKVSPLEASASYLKHIRSVWSHQFPEAPLEAQDIIITVPASFDEAARRLTLEAAQLAGLTQIRLLEEPQAVCYDWLHRHQGKTGAALNNAHLLLVCDVGGGTTDFTLIKVDHNHTEPQLSRIGVGDHLMLGGDNIDLALAHRAEKRISPDKKLPAAEFSQLIEQCRQAKEKLLAENAPEQLTVTLLGGGSKLIGGSRSASFSRAEVQDIALDGFFPLSAINELPDKKRSGVVEFGLPYAAEPAVSKHIAAFLNHHAQSARDARGDEHIVPDALLLNGGVFRSQPIARRLQNLIASWNQHPPLLLDNTYPELAVAYGAVSYALAKQHKTSTIGGGAARSYFLILDDQQQQKQGVCLLTKGTAEGEEHVLKDQSFALRVGQPVRFHLMTCSADGDFKPGQIYTLENETFHSLPPLAVALEGQENSEVIVQLAVTHSELGTLQIQCVAQNNPEQRWDVEFQLRKSSAAVNLQTTQLPAQIIPALDAIRAVFGSRSKDANPKAVKSLRADLEKTLNQPRNDWETHVLRALFDELLSCIKNRRRSENHERLWLNLTGFCLRPGYGYPLDDWRVEQLWKIYSNSIQYVNSQQNWSEWWTLWRRLAGGLDSDAQQLLFKHISKFLDPASARQGNIAKQIKTRGYEDMVRLAGTMERLPVENKEQMGTWLLKRLQKTSEPRQTWWALGRIGSRMPFYGDRHEVISLHTAQQWLVDIMKSDWKKIPEAAFAATLIARKSGDRALDIDDELRDQVIKKLQQSKVPSSWINMVTEVHQLDEKEAKQVFGEALPPGLKLLS